MSDPSLEPTVATEEGNEASRAAFVARVTAGATHEFRNTLAVIKESAGLVEDLIRAAGGVGPDRERVLRTLQRIALQVDRGVELTTSLNRVMHGLDRREEPVDLADALHHAVLLTRRGAGRRGCRVELAAAGDPPGGALLTAVPASEPAATGGATLATPPVAEVLAGPAVTTNALELYRGLVEMLEWCLEGIPEGGTLQVTVGRQADSGAVRVTAQPPAGSGFLRAEKDRRRLSWSLRQLPVSVQIPTAESLILLFR